MSSAVSLALLSFAWGACACVCLCGVGGWGSAIFIGQKGKGWGVVYTGTASSACHRHCRVRRMSFDVHCQANQQAAKKRSHVDLLTDTITLCKGETMFLLPCLGPYCGPFDQART